MQKSPNAHRALVLRITRRSLLSNFAALGLASPGVRQPRALASPIVRVEPPRIVHGDGCMARVSAALTIEQATPGLGYEVYGEIVELDEPDGEPDVCCSIALPSPVMFAGTELKLLLESEVQVAALGLVKGVGPAADESFSPDLIELVARVWMREAATGVEHGPWESPPRVAVASAAGAWTQSAWFPGSELMMPRPGGAAALKCT